MISEALNIQKGITSIIGGGGKTTLMHVLAQELSATATVVITTTTHIMKSDVFHNVITQKNQDNIMLLKNALQTHRCVCVGSKSMGEKLSAPTVSIDELLSICDYVLVEADGSKHLPLKAHLQHEPVIPTNSDKTILVCSVDALGQKVKDAVHRPQKACELLSSKMGDRVTPLMVAQLINAENLHDEVVINKCDDDTLKQKADTIAQNVKSKCIIASLVKGEWYVSSN